MAEKVRKNPKKSRYLALTPTEEDIAFATRQNRYACLIVRCIQRTLPDAVRVMVDSKHIAFSLERDDTRYTFETPPEVVERIIKPFDRKEPVEPFTFTLTDAIAAEPVHHRTVEERQAARNTSRASRRKTTTKNVAVRHLNRFMDTVQDDAE